MLTILITLGIMSIFGVSVCLIASCVLDDWN